MGTEYMCLSAIEYDLLKGRIKRLCVWCCFVVLLNPILEHNWFLFFGNQKEHKQFNTGSWLILIPFNVE